ncbi:unnamed protein product [Closterium sp. NIES-53]
MHNGASWAKRLRASASVRIAVFYGATLCCSVGTLSTCCVGRSPFCSAGAAPLRNAGRRSTMLCCRLTRLTAELLAAIVTMVDPVANAGVADTLEARLANVRKRHKDGEYGTIPLLIVELGIRSQWATEHPPRPVSPRSVQNEGVVNDEFDGGARVSGNNGTKQRGVIKVNDGVDRIQARVQQSTEVAGSSHADVDCRRRSHLRSGGGLSATMHVMAGGIAPTDDLYIAQLEEKMTHIQMGEQESATDYCNRARRILAEMRMAGAKYSTASYISHIVKGLPRGYNLMKRMMMVPATRESHDEDSITSYILQDEAMQEAEQPTELLPQVNYAAPTKLNQQQGQRRKPSGGGRSTKDVDEKRSTQDKGHISYECPNGGSVGSATIPTTFPTSVPTAMAATRTTPREAAVDRPAVAHAVAAVVQANLMAVLLDSGCSHHLMEAKTVFVDMAPSDGVKHVRGFNGALQPVEGYGTAKKSDMMLRSDWGGELLGKEFTDFVDGKSIVHDLTGPYTPQQNGMAEWEMRTAVESVRTMLLHMGVQHHWWHLALRQAVWVRNCLEWSTTPPGTTPYQLLTGKKPDLTLARVWGCMVQSMVPAQQRGGKLAPKARWGLHVGVSPESKGWEVLNLTDNKVVTSVEVIFYETLSLEVWKAKFGPASGRTQAHPPTDTSTATAPLLVKVDEPANEDVMEVLPPPPVLAPPLPVADRPASTPVSATGDEGSLEASPVATASGIAGGRQGAKLVNQDGMPSTIGEQQTGEPLVENLTVNEEGELSAEEESTDSDVVEVPITKPELRRTGRARRPPERLSFHACLPPAVFTAEYNKVDDDLLYDDAEEDEELPELDPDMHADPEHHWDIATMTVKEALVSWKGEAVKAAMEEEIRSLVGMGTWELVERPRGVNIMKNRWVLTTKYRLDDTIERKKARLVVKGFTQVCGADYDEMYSPVSSYVTMRIFLSIVAVFDLNLMQLDMKNGFLQSKLDRVLYMYQPDYFDDGTGRVCKLLKSLYGLKQSPLLWYRALDGVLLGAGWKKSHVDEALYFKASDDGVTCWVLVYVDNLLAACSSPAMLKKVKQLLEDVFELRKISPVVKYLGLEIVRDRPAKKLWLHQQSYADKLRRRFIDEEQGGRVPKTPVSVDAYAELTFDDEEAQEHKEEEYRQKVGSLQSDQHWSEVDRCLAYLTDTRNTALEFGGGPESLELIGYVVADDAGDKQKRTSTSGYVFVYGGAAVSWSSSRIKCATLSSTESEYVAATNAGKEGRQLCFLLAEFKLLDARKPTILRVDNKSAITVAAGLGLTGNLKHME